MGWSLAGKPGRLQSGVLGERGRKLLMFNTSPTAFSAQPSSCWKIAGRILNQTGPRDQDSHHADRQAVSISVCTGLRGEFEKDANLNLVRTLREGPSPITPWREAPTAPRSRIPNRNLRKTNGEQVEHSSPFWELLGFVAYGALAFCCGGAFPSTFKTNPASSDSKSAFALVWRHGIFSRHKSPPPPPPRGGGSPLLLAGVSGFEPRCRGASHHMGPMGNIIYFTEPVVAGWPMGWPQASDR